MGKRSRLRKRESYIMNPLGWAVLVLIAIVLIFIGEIANISFLDNIGKIFAIIIVIYLLVVFLLELSRDVIGGAD